MATNIKFKINPNLRILLLPLVSLIVFIILTVITGNYGYKQIIKLNNEITDKKTTISKLEDKLNILREVEETVLAKSDATLLAIPSKNSSLWTYLMIKNNLLKNNLNYENLNVTVNATPNAGIDSYNYSVEINTEDIVDFVNFVDDIYNSAPRMFVTFAVISSRGNNFNISTQIASYSSPLPTKIPALTQPIKTLTEDELVSLDKLVKLTPPEFTTLEPKSDSIRTNPFR